MTMHEEHGSVLVTGGANGIGAAIAETLEARGWQVIVLDRAKPKSSFNGKYVEVDMSDHVATASALNELCSNHSILRLVNNVGAVQPALVDKTSVDDFHRVMELNALSALVCCQAVLPAMRSAKFGRIVSVTSRALLGKEMRTAYSASKAAVAGMTRTWALELASEGITANTVAPGPIGTDLFHQNNPPNNSATQKILAQVPVQRVGRPDEVAHAVSFFLDERSGFITGQTLFVCGGMTVGLSTI
jgi:3-oxoacyl-[acyl-carrier protein] reductase